MSCSPSKKQMSFKSQVQNFQLENFATIENYATINVGFAISGLKTTSMYNSTMREECRDCMELVSSY